MKYPQRTGGAPPWKGGGRPAGGKKPWENRDHSSGGKKPWERGSDSRDGGKPFMHKATCGDCGSSCEVPFKPSGARPVLCNNCFRKDDGGDSRRPSPRSESRSFDRPMPRTMSDTNSGASSAVHRELVDQMKMVNAKLDTLIHALSAKSAAPVATDAVPAKKVVKKKKKAE